MLCNVFVPVKSSGLATEFYSNTVDLTLEGLTVANPINEVTKKAIAKKQGEKRTEKR